jgi:methionyl-tRNA formyltransferase
MTDDIGLSWEAQEVFQKIKSFNRLPGAGIPLIQLNIKVGSAKTVKKGIRELESTGLITSTASGEPTLTDKGHKTSI